jgi:hypothetical protein
MSDENKNIESPQENNKHQENTDAKIENKENPEKNEPDNTKVEEQKKQDTPENHPKNEIHEQEGKNDKTKEEHHHEEHPKEEGGQVDQKENIEHNPEENNEDNMEENEEEDAQEPEKPIIDSGTIEKEKKKYAQRGIEDIQRQIQEMTKKIEHEKINLRITTERLNQREKVYNDLQGKPVLKTQEEKERERREHKKAIKRHKLSDPIIRKKGKENEFYEEKMKIQKAYDKNKIDFEKLTCDINELVIGNQNLKAQIVDLRKRKVEAEKQLQNISEENKQSQEELNEILNDNQALKDQIKYKEYKKVVEFGNNQEKNFEEQRDNYEGKYHELIKDFVRREKEAKKENAKKRQMALLGSGATTPHFKGLNDKDIEKQLKFLAEEEISDRTPILDLAIEKWTGINKVKKLTLDKHYENCVKIEEAFKKLTNFLGLDNFNELPNVFRKTEQQISNINFYNEKLDLQLDKLEKEKEDCIEQIKLLSGKKIENYDNKSKFIEQKQQSIKVIENLISKFEKDIEHKRNIFIRIQPATDDYLEQLGNTYISEFVKKANIDKSIEYNEQTVNKYLSNVQDYYKLIQSWDESSKEKKDEDNKDIEKLREEMKQKLGGFEKNRIISKKMINSMKNELKNGVNIEDIIKKTSLEITSQNLNNSLLSSIDKSGKFEQNNSSAINNNSQLPTDLYNYQSGYDSSHNFQQQNSIIVPNNNSSSVNNNNLSNQENNKVPES